MKKLFVVGCPRSGTTVLQQALNRHSQVAFPPETSFLFLLGFPRKDQKDHWARITRDLDIDLPFPSGGIGGVGAARRLFGHMATAYLRRVGREGVTYFGEKSPEHQLRLGLVRKAFPAAKVILIYRDGREVALSLAKVPWMFKDLELSFALWLHYHRAQMEAVQWGWPNLLCVQYERLVANPEAELRTVVEFLGLPYEPQVAAGAGDRNLIADREVAWKARSLEQITDARVGRWRQELSPEQLATLEGWGGDALRSLGYELATDGSHRLPLVFFPKLYTKSLLWSLRQGRYKVLKEVGRQGLRVMADYFRRSVGRRGGNSSTTASPAAP